MTSLTLLFVCASGVLAAALALLVALVLKARARAGEDLAEVRRLTLALEQERSAAAVREDSFAVRLTAKDEACRALLAEKDEACRRSLAEKDQMIERLLKAQGEKFNETIKALQENFGNIATAKMGEQQKNLTTLNRSQIEQVVKPLREQLEGLQKLTLQAQDSNFSLEKSMNEHVEAIGRIAGSLNDVANALSSNTRFQGRRGEEILAEKLRQAGLEENVNFFLQTGSADDRPDAQVCDTENRWLIIDSKVNLTAYMAYMETKDDKQRKERLADHVASVRRHIDELARKKYPRVFQDEHRERNYLPITAMFVAYEAPLMVALKEDPSLWQLAAQNNVILVTPLTLLAYLRLVYLAWQHEKEARNQSAIVDTARELLKRTNDFLKTFEDLGDALDAVLAGYAKAKGILVDAPHAQTIANSARKLIGLHVRLENKKGKRLEVADCLRDDAEDALAETAEVK